ncbi:putative quinol monooxygenase [Pseudoalteromonas sp.]|uniref:putative quinol monooxygenase n=1 Tax=Pseudoalteromonas sp. TaxID=53249 RepID=UPI00300387F7
MINIVAKITPKPELFDDCKGRLQSILTATRAESGCIRFELYSNAEQHCLFLVEQFASQEALDSHYQQPYVTAVFAFYESALAVPVEVNYLQAVT